MEWYDSYFSLVHYHHIPNDNRLSRFDKFILKHAILHDDRLRYNRVRSCPTAFIVSVNTNWTFLWVRLMQTQIEIESLRDMNSILSPWNYSLPWIYLKNLPSFWYSSDSSHIFLLLTFFRFSWYSSESERWHVRAKFKYLQNETRMHLYYWLKGNIFASSTQIWSKWASHELNHDICSKYKKDGCNSTVNMSIFDVIKPNDGAERLLFFKYFECFIEKWSFWWVRLILLVLIAS